LNKVFIHLQKNVYSLGSLHNAVDRAQEFSRGLHGALMPNPESERSVMDKKINLPPVDAGSDKHISCIKSYLHEYQLRLQLELLAELIKTYEEKCGSLAHEKAKIKVVNDLGYVLRQLHLYKEELQSELDGVTLGRNSLSCLNQKTGADCLHDHSFQISKAD